jgi:hypothetical protein
MRALVPVKALSVALLKLSCVGCSEAGGFSQPTLEQRLASGKSIRVTSCLLVWGVEHGERHPDQDSYALEYVSALPSTAGKELDQEALEAFELIRPVSEQWGFSRASVSAFTSVERTGTYNIFNLSRSPDGRWSFTRNAAKVYNTESGNK